MNQKPFRTACLILFLSAFTGSISLALTVTGLKVEGNQNVDQASIVNASQLAVGDSVDADGLSSALRRIYALGYFKDVQLRTDSTGMGSDLTFMVAEKPLVERVEFLGNEKISTQDLEDTLTVRPGSMLDKKIISQNAALIRNMYLEKGYSDATVRDTLIESGSKYSLRYVIDEGRKVRVKKIVFTGNPSLKSRDLIKAMTTKQRGFTLLWKAIPWYRKGAYSQDTLTDDLARVERYCQNYGFIEAKAGLDSVSYNDDRDRVTAFINLTEGTKYRVGQLTFDGNEKITTPKLKRALALRSGQIYSADQADKTLENLYTIYTEEGFIYCRVIPEPSLHDSTADMRYSILENNPAHIRQVIIAGNTKTRDKVIRRQLKVLPGDLFRRSLVIRSQREVFSLGFFEDVQIGSQPADTSGDIDLIFTVKEKQVGQFQVGTTYGATDGLAGFVQIGMPNLFGRGQEINFKTEFSSKKFNLDLGFTEPWLFDTPTSAGIDLYRTTYSYSTYDEERIGGGVRLGRPIPWLDYTRGYWQYNLERLDIYNISASASSGLTSQTWPRISSSTGLSLVRDSRDRPFNATSGSRTMVSSEFCGGLLQGQVDYQKYIGEYRYYHPLFWKLAVMARARAGVVDGYSSPNTVPISERFFVGGAGEDGIRGYPDRSISTSYGGRAMAVSNLELRYGINSSIYTMLFLDAGNSWPSVKDARAEAYKGLGAGVRMEIPMIGILGFDWAYGFDRRNLPYPLNDHWEFHFQIGTTF
ncbi:MAG: outer membrane protein assembly factor BamA [bacterium]|nr:outer membrane protein assembly factor BamA [bacterium]